MMIYAKDHKTRNFFDPWEHLGPKRKKMLTSSWAGLFQKEILPILPVDEIASSFSQNDGRLTKELYSAIGAVVLQQILDKTDEETVFAFSFDLQWHYALNITDEDDSACYLCEKSLWNYRNLLATLQLEKVLFEKVVDRFANIFSVDTNKQRIDSVHIESNMCSLSRIAIFAKVINKFLVNLKRHHPSEYNNLPADIKDTYGSKKSIGVFSLIKPSNSVKTLASCAKTLFELVMHFRENETVRKMTSHGLLVRVLEEQCVVNEGSDKETLPVEVKAPKDVFPGSLQNPSDIDASYDSHKGKGYQGQVMETYARENNETTLNLITYVHVEQAHKSDVHALLPALEETGRRECSPTEVLADTLYGGDENCQKAKEMGTTVIAPVVAQKKDKKKLWLDEFFFSATGELIACPAQKKPLHEIAKKERRVVSFSKETCSSCPRLKECRIDEGKKLNKLYYSEKELRVALRRIRERSPEFIDTYRYRSGIEATNSELQTRTGIKRMRVRGLKMMSFCFTLKALGINLFRANKVKTLRGRRPEGGGIINFGIRIKTYIAFTNNIYRSIVGYTAFCSLSQRFTKNIENI